jgi:2,5-diketo-D-gluconate reductase A
MTGTDATRLVPLAVAQGYRLFDTAERYANEEGVGEGVRRGGLPREDIFIASKFNVEWHGSDLVTRALDSSLRRLGLDYLDLFMIHWPNPWAGRYVDAWRGLIRARRSGKIGAAGVCNFTGAQLRRLIDETGEIPEVNQIELNPLASRVSEVALHEDLGVVTQSWSPLARGNRKLLSSRPIKEAAMRSGRTAAQVVLRWHLQRGLSAVPKSADPERMSENLDVFTFSLNATEMTEISSLNRTSSYVVRDSEQFGH